MILQAQEPAVIKWLDIKTNKHVKKKKTRCAQLVPPNRNTISQHPPTSSGRLVNLLNDACSFTKLVHCPILAGRLVSSLLVINSSTNPVSPPKVSGNLVRPLDLSPSR